MQMNVSPQIEETTAWMKSARSDKNNIFTMLNNKNASCCP